MIGRRLAAAVLLLGGLVVQEAVVTAETVRANGAVDKCRRSGSRTLLQSGVVRVFVSRGRTYGCLRSEGRARALDTRSSDVESRVTEVFALAGPYAALTLDAESLDSGLSSRALVVLDVRRPRPTKTVVGQQFNERVTKAVLRANGSVAYIRINPDAPGETVVGSRDCKGLRSLASGSVIVPTSLRLIGSRVSWLEGDMRRGSELC